MKAKLKAIHTHAFDFWLARSSVVAVVALQLLIIHDLTLGPRWLAPTLELTLLLPLSIATAWAQGRAKVAETEHHWRLIERAGHAIRALAVALTALVTVMNFGTLVFLVRALLDARAAQTGQTLLLDALNIWTTNVIAFALWFWSIDRGGPASRGLVEHPTGDFLFPQMMLDQVKNVWSPGFTDYLYLSFTNATAFSPTDTMPLTSRAKVLMMAESMTSLLTLALVAARAVNVLA